MRTAIGDVDVFHFQNIEGLTAGFIESLRKQYSDSKFILTCHNYNIICPQVNLWFREMTNCVDYKDGNKCVNCIFNYTPIQQRKERRSLQRRYIPNLFRPTIGKCARFYNYLRSKERTASGGSASPEIEIISKSKADIFKHYRMRNISIANSVFDDVIAVSQRSKDVLVKFGLSEKNITVLYIGTKFKLSDNRIVDFRDKLHVAYCGYMRLDKGFLFFT